MSFSSQKGEFDRFFNRLDRPVEESRPDRQPDRPVDQTGAGRPDRFPSLSHPSIEISHLAYHQHYIDYLLIVLPESNSGPKFQTHCLIQR